MKDFTNEIVELIRLASTNLRKDIENKIRQGLNNEDPNSAAYQALKSILTNIEMARKDSIPICQDTGTPIFYVHYPDGLRQNEILKQIQNAIEAATLKGYLRPNAVNPLTGKNSGNNLGDKHFPEIIFYEVSGETWTIDILLKGGGCENVSAQYSLPFPALKAERDLEGVRRVILDTVYQAQGEGCAPGFLGVAIGGDRASSNSSAKETHLIKLNQNNPITELNLLEKRVTKESNDLGIGPMGFGGKTTILDTKITSTFRLPASYFVSISYMCWAFRHRRLIIHGEEISYE